MINMGAKQGAAFRKFADRLFPAMHMYVATLASPSHRLTDFYSSRLSKLALMQRYRSIVELSSPGSISYVPSALTIADH